MTTSLDGRTALVTGGGKGIGRAVALALAAQGANVIITGRDERALGEVVGEIAFGGGKARHLAGDVRDRAHLAAAVARAVDTFGGLDIVVANAGRSGRVDLGGDFETARAILATNLVGTYATFDAAAPHLRSGGRLVAVSSVLGKFGVPGYAAYCASKAGLIGLVRAVAQELGPRKITCNAICPGWVDTEMASSGIEEIARARGISPATAKADALAAFPLGRFIEPEEIAALVLFLCAKSGDAVTGQALSMCGGATS